MKILFDYTLSIAVLLMFSPVFIVVILFIIIDDPGNPFFKHQRIGLHGKVFGMYKFRSMKLNASENGPYFTQKDDPRITRVGKILRKTSIDEFPQFLNVLLGDMSIVGPRPDVSQQRSNYSKEQWRLRCSVKPGITGLAQALHRSEATQEQRIAMDLDYVNNQSFTFDIKIVFLTIKQIIVKGGN